MGLQNVGCAMVSSNILDTSYSCIGAIVGIFDSTNTKEIQPYDVSRMFGDTTA